MQREELRDEPSRRASVMLEPSINRERILDRYMKILGLKLGLRAGGQNAEYRARRNLPLSVGKVLLTVYR